MWISFRSAAEKQMMLNSHPHSLQKYHAAHLYSPWFTFTQYGQKKSLCCWNNVKHKATLHHTQTHTNMHIDTGTQPPPLIASRLLEDVSQRGRGCCEDMPNVRACVCGGGLCEPVRWEGKGRGRGGHSVLFLIDQQLLSLVQREKGRGRAVWREAVRVLSV